MSSISRKRVIQDGLVLPGVLEDIAEAAGIDAALKLAEAFGGTELVIPAAHRVCADHQLAKIVGLDAARKICELWVRGTVLIPGGPANGRTKQQMLMRQRLLEGVSASLVAKEVGVHLRTVWRMKQDMRIEGDPVAAKPTKVRATTATKKRRAVKGDMVRQLLHLSNAEIMERTGASPGYIKLIRRDARRADAARLGKPRVK